MATSNLFQDMIDNKYSDEQIATILREMAQRGETVDEITAAVQCFRQHALPLPLESADDLMDTCGTGGSGLPRMNISTTAAFVLAAAGVKVAKHGNKAASGRCGSFDLLEALGLKIDLTPEQIAKNIQHLNLGFLYAPHFHPALKKFMPIRKQLALRTVFNLIGPLLNPAHPTYHLLGVPSRQLAQKLIQVMKNFTYKHALVVVGEDGLDEVTLQGKTFCYELKNGDIKEFTFSPQDIGLPLEKNLHTLNGNPQENVELFHELILGKAPSPLQNLLELNCAFAFYTRDITPTIATGLELARKTINSGGAHQKFLSYKNNEQ